MCQCLPHQICPECAGKARSVASVAPTKSAVRLLDTLGRWTVKRTYLEVLDRIERMAAGQPGKGVSGQDVATAMSKVGKAREGL